MVIHLDASVPNGSATQSPESLADSAESSTNQPLCGSQVLIVVENLPVPFDRRVWLEATTLHAAGAEVNVICPKGKGFEKGFESIDGIRIYRHSLPLDANNSIGYLIEYSAAIFMESVLAWYIYFRHGFDVIHGCNPPDLIFLVAAPFRLLGVKFIFDHHDINPELFEAKFGKRGFFWRLMVLLERLTFRLASVSLATNQSYREIAIERGKMHPSDVFVVRSGPDLSRVQPVPAVETWRNGRKFMVGYVGVMGQQEGIDLLLQAVSYIVEIGRTDVQFVLVGRGPFLDQAKGIAAKLHVDEFVTFTGRIPDKELFEVLSTSDVCVNPDRVNPMNDKSTMNKIMEYMAFSKAIVQFDVKEGRHSALQASLYADANDPHDLADKILQLLDDPEQRRRMGEFGRERVETELQWNRSVPSLLAAYNKVLGKQTNFL